MTRVTTHLPYKLYYLPLLILSVAGILNALYLFYAHYQNYTDPTYASFCAISRAINCDTVAQNPWSVLFGLPVALWGLVGYLISTLLLIPLRHSREEVLPLWSLMVITGAGFALAAVFFGYISVSKIHSYCIMCLLTYGINFGLFFGSWLIRRRFSDAPLMVEIPRALSILRQKKWLTGSLGLMMIAVSLMIVMLPKYWSFAPKPVNDDIAHGITADGHPWIGAENPEMTITEFSDYMCFQCKKMHFILRQLVQSYPDKIRLIHRHFPMDHAYNPLVKDPFHSGSGKMAILALYAQTKGKFWDVNDFLFELAGTKQDFNTRAVAEFMDAPRAELAAALKAKPLRLLLKHDIAVGLQKGISGTPGFVVNDQVYLGNIPSDILRQVVSNGAE
ncbi:MAG: vitamin K epoxide reductase family protein [Desulfobacterales bacterium]|nr:vitamin K epoxide reductase family protein [Desulfobacterales bacterium]